jgi:hypothetical protein
MAMMKAAKSSESYEDRRKRELRPVIEQLDAELRVLVERVRISRESSGFVRYQELPSHPGRDVELLEIERNRLLAARNAALAEFSSL